VTEPRTDAVTVHAHRGFRRWAPQNTVSALCAAAEHAAVVEFDVRPTGDGDPVVFHDERLDELTDGTGRVGELSTETVCATEVCDSGETVPQLHEVVAAIPDRGDERRPEEPGLSGCPAR
jgi:glycerophosphoryl diester phosphodiesterase